MLFNSFEYLIFLPIVFLIYWSVFDYALSKCQHQLLLQNLFIVVASYIFYGWWDWRFLILIAITTILSFLSGIGIERAPAQRGKKAKDKLTQMIESYILDREQMTNLFLLIDIRHEPLAIDLEFIEWLGENGVPFAIIFTKADKLSQAQLNRNVKSYKQTLSEAWEELPPMFISSSEKGTWREEILQFIETLLTNY